MIGGKETVYGSYMLIVGTLTRMWTTCTTCRCRLFTLDAMIEVYFFLNIFYSEGHSLLPPMVLHNCILVRVVGDASPQSTFSLSNTANVLGGSVPSQPVTLVNYIPFFFTRMS